MTSIYKYELPLFDIRSNQPFYLTMPRGAQVLGVQLQDGVPVLWAVVTPGSDVMARRLTAFWTGTWLPDPVGTYAGTWQKDGLVWHLFDQGEQ